MQDVPISDFIIGKNQPLTLISGPCVIEDEEEALQTAIRLQKITEKLNINFVYKSSYDKANRSSHSSFRGPGQKEGLRILKKIKEQLNIPVTSDIHSPEEAKEAAEVCDILQIPAFLCRQTDLILAAAETGRVINVKKGQFMAPWDMPNVIDKILTAGNKKIILTDRGTSFGYNNLVSDMRSIPIMQSFGFPVCFDATHSAQLPGGLGSSSGGQRTMIPYLTRAAVAAGCNILFIESHQDPTRAKSDKETVMALDELEPLLTLVLKLYQVVNHVS